MTIENHSYSYYCFFSSLSHQTSFLLYKCRFDEVNFTRSCFHDGKSKTKNKQTAEVGFLGSISQTIRKCTYERWTTVGEALRHSCACHFESLFDSIGTEELFTNVHKPIETMPYFLLTLLFVSPSSFLWQSV